MESSDAYFQLFAYLTDYLFALFLLLAQALLLSSEELLVATFSIFQAFIRTIINMRSVTTSDHLLVDSE